MFRPARFFFSAQAPVPRRHAAGYVSRMRYLHRLKEDGEACLSALQSARILLFHRLRPLLQPTDPGAFRSAPLTCSDVQSVLQKLGVDGSLLKESVLIGCSHHNQAQFSLDADWTRARSKPSATEPSWICGKPFSFWMKWRRLWWPRAKLCFAGIRPAGSAAPRGNRPTGTSPAATGSAGPAPPSTTPRCPRWRSSWSPMGPGAFWADSLPSLGGCTVLLRASVTWERPLRRRCAGRWRRRWAWRSRASGTAPRSTGHSLTAPSWWAATPLLAPPTPSWTWITRSWRTLAGSLWMRSSAP